MRYRLRLLSNSGHKLGTREFETEKGGAIIPH